MSKLKKKLNYLYKKNSSPQDTSAPTDTQTTDESNENSGSKDTIEQKWQNLNGEKGLSTKEKLEKLVKLSLKREKVASRKPAPPMRYEQDEAFEEADDSGSFIARDYTYPLDRQYGPVTLENWRNMTSRKLEIMFGDEAAEEIDPMKLVFFDTETTGLSGGAGTIPFLLGFGYFEDKAFQVRIYILTDLTAENQFLEEIDRFLEFHRFSGTVTYNGKSFDFPLMEGRYIMQRKRFPLLRLPHLDFLFPARTIWKNTYDSRKLGYLGDMLVDIPRDDDIDGSRIPALYFNFLRIKSIRVLEKVVEHNALDLLGLAALVLLGARYIDDISTVKDEGEILGIARLNEKFGDIDKALHLYETLNRTAVRTEVLNRAAKGLAIIKKRKKLYQDARQLWELLADSSDRMALRELSIHFEHREKDDRQALHYVKKALETINLTEAQRTDFEKRLTRLTKRLKTLDNDF